MGRVREEETTSLNTKHYQETVDSLVNYRCYYCSLESNILKVFKKNEESLKTTTALLA